MKRLGALIVVLSVMGGAVAQTTTAAGHWEGVIQFPQKQVKISVDLAQNERGEWTGSMALPQQKMELIVLTNIVVKDETVSVKSMPWLMGVDAELSPDGRTIKGDFLSAFQRTVPVPIELQRVSAARVNPSATNTPLARELEGIWEGAGKLGSSWESDDPRAGSAVNIRLKLAGGPGGMAAGSLLKAAGEVPFSLVTQQGASIRLELAGEGAVFVGELRGRDLVGDWSQFDADPVPLTLKRNAPK